MANPATPTEKGTEKKTGEFTYGRDDHGNLLIDGVVVDKHNETAVVDEDEEPEGAQNAVVEGKEVPPGKEAAPEPPPKAPAPEPPKPTDKQKFKLKVQGEEFEREYTNEELVSRLQMAEDYQKKTMQLAEDRRKIEPFMPIIDKPEFKQWLGEQVEAGVLEAPRIEPPPSPEDVIGFRIREHEPEFKDIQLAMSEWAATLPVYEAKILNSNPKVFNDTYDRFKAARKAMMDKVSPPHPPQPEPAKTDPKTLEKILQSKETSKEKARLETPGGTPPEVDPMKEWRKIDRELRKAVQDNLPQVKYKGRWVEPATAWAWHRYQPPE